MLSMAVSPEVKDLLVEEFNSVNNRGEAALCRLALDLGFEGSEIIEMFGIKDESWYIYLVNSYKEIEYILTENNRLVWKAH